MLLHFQGSLTAPCIPQGRISEGGDLVRQLQGDSPGPLQAITVEIEKRVRTEV